MKKIFYLCAAVLFLSACGVKYKSIPYFTDLPAGNLSEEIQNQTILKIQKDDILAITVSSLSNEASAIFNMGNTSVVQSGAGAGNNAANAVNGFIVDQTGSIQLPYLGSIKVEGLSTAEARDMIQSKLIKGDYLKQPIVSLRLANFKVSVIGDVARPGVYPVQSERITVIEALGMAGDLNITAKRNDILLTRENGGKREQIRLNLQSKELFNSPYYYLQNNDVLYVVPSEAKYASIDSTYRNAGILISVLSLLVVVVSRF